MMQQMSTRTAMNDRAALDAAYRATCYCVDLPDGARTGGRIRLRLRIGEPSEAFSAALKAAGVTRWAIVAAVNPGSVALPAEENAARHQALVDTVAVSGRNSWPGVNEADSGNWLTEPTLCILDIGLQDALRLAAGFGQNAIVAGGADGLPVLVWISPTHV
ncbi:MAG: DUF3293 domain-containing protein [Betaproteobacteria bacterium]|nr:DUF3293 domain-containing protein [Betaproteobacteria bacterium]